MLGFKGLVEVCNSCVLKVAVRHNRMRFQFVVFRRGFGGALAGKVRFTCVLGLVLTSYQVCGELKKTHKSFLRMILPKVISKFQR